MGPDGCDAAREAAETAKTKTPLDVTPGSQAPCANPELVGALSVRRVYGSQLGLEACVHPTFLLALGEGSESPERGRQRRDREQQEIDSEFVFEA